MRHSPTLLEKLTFKTKKYLTRSVLASAITLSSYGCSPPLINNNGNTNEPTIVQNDNSQTENPPNQGNVIQEAILNEDNNENHIAQIYTLQGDKIDMWGEKENDGDISYITDIKLESSNSETYIKVDPSGRIKIAQNEDGYGFQVNEYLSDNRADVTYYAPNNNQARVILDIFPIPTNVKFSRYITSDSCTQFQEITDELCDIYNVVKYFTSPAGLKALVLDYVLGNFSDLESILEDGEFSIDPIGMLCDNIEDCNDINISLESLIEELPPQFSPDIIEEPPLPELDRIAEGGYYGEVNCFRTIEIPNLGLQADNSSEEYPYGFFQGNTPIEAWGESISENGIPFKYVNNSTEIYKGLESSYHYCADLTETDCSTKKHKVLDLNQYVQGNDNILSYIYEEGTYYDEGNEKDVGNYFIGSEPFRCAITGHSEKQIVTLSQSKNHNDKLDLEMRVEEEIYNMPDPPEFPDVTYESCGTVYLVSECTGTLEKQ